VKRKKIWRGVKTLVRAQELKQEGVMTTETQSAPVAERGERTILTAK